MFTENDIKNDGQQKQYAHIMEQNNWFRMMGISNVFFIVWCYIAMVTLNLFRPFISILSYFHVAHEILLYSWRWEGCCTKFQCFDANRIFTGKVIGRSVRFLYIKVATKSEEYNMFLGQLGLTHTKKIAALMNEAPMKYPFKVMKKERRLWMHSTSHKFLGFCPYLFSASCSKICARH